MSATVRAPGPVLVGVDGSGRNASAVAWAAAEAGSADAPLVLVHDVGSAAGAAAGRATVDRAVAEVTKLDRALTPQTEVVSEGPAAGLVRAAHDYGQLGGDAAGSMVVVGRRGSGGFTRLRLGSTARHLVNGHGPTTVVVPSDWERDTVPATAPVVVDITPPGAGSDEPSAGDPLDTDGVDRALATAMDRARRDDRPVLALRAWSVDPEQAHEGRGIRDVWGEHAARAEEDLTALLDRWRALYPGVEVVGIATDRHPVAALLDHAEDAELLVVPRGPRASAVVEYATAPVAVV